MTASPKRFTNRVLGRLLSLAASAWVPSALALAAGPPQYKVVASPGRGADLRVFERLLNDMASQGWEFDRWLYRGSAQEPDLIFRRNKDFVGDPAAAASASRLDRVVAFRTGELLPLGIVEGQVSIDSVTVIGWPRAETLKKARPDDTTKVTLRFTYTNRDIKNWKCDYSVVLLDEKGAELASGEESEAHLDKRKEGDTNDVTVKLRTLDFPVVSKLSIRVLPRPN